MTTPILLCDMPGCGLHDATVPYSDGRVRCVPHFWTEAPIPEPPEDERVVDAFREPE